jgi:hypothetical protein
MPLYGSNNSYKGLDRTRYPSIKGCIIVGAMSHVAESRKIGVM